jgi:hypothetical protein
VNCNPASFIHKKAINERSLRRALTLGSINKERRRMLLLPDVYASELKDLIDDRLSILMMLGAKIRLHF